MTQEQKAAYIIGEAACLMARVAGMQAENQNRMARGETVAYLEDAFQNLIDDSQCTHNAMIRVFHEW